LPGTGGTVTFKYDPLGRRIEKSSSAATSVYAYDADNLIEETNASGTVVARYSQSQNIDEPLAMLRSSATSYYNADGLGSVTSLTNSSGAAAETYTYYSFGNVTASSGSLTNPFQYTGRELDSETGLYNNRSRYYDPALGRFDEEDVVGFGGGKNFYAYVDNNPVTDVDPLGLAKCIYSISAHTLVCIPNADPGRPTTTGPNGAGAVQLGPGGVWSGVAGCANTPSCVGSHDLGPIVPGNYNMNKDDRPLPGHSNFWRLEPNPKIPFWKCWFGLARCGFELHPGSLSLGCITTNKTDQQAMQQYDAVNGLLNQENGSNHLTVIP
jgi:RHS repeat-associated protein